MSCKANALYQKASKAKGSSRPLGRRHPHATENSQLLTVLSGFAGAVAAVSSVNTNDDKAAKVLILYKSTRQKCIAAQINRLMLSGTERTTSPWWLGNRKIVVQNITTSSQVGIVRRCCHIHARIIAIWQSFVYEHDMLCMFQMQYKPPHHKRLIRAHHQKQNEPPIQR